MHAIRTDTTNALLIVSITGFWSVDEVAELARDLVPAAARLFAQTGRQHSTLYDYSEAIIQSQEVVAAFQRMAVSFGGPARSRRAALYTGRGMARMQARRIAAMREDMQVFDDRDAALDWLSQDDSMPALLRLAR